MDILFPVRCFTCGNVIGGMYNHYIRETKKRKIASGERPELLNRVKYLKAGEVEYSVEGQVLNDMGINLMCCRRHFLAHVHSS